MTTAAAAPLLVLLAALFAASLVAFFPHCARLLCMQAGKSVATTPTYLSPDQLIFVLSV
jgi:hypothetical protein